MTSCTDVPGPGSTEVLGNGRWRKPDKQAQRSRAEAANRRALRRQQKTALRRSDRANRQGIKALGLD